MSTLSIGPSVSLLAVIMMGPILWAIAASFFQVNPFSPDWTYVGMENYQSIIADPAFWTSVQRAAVFAAGNVSLQVVLGVTLAVVINRKLPFQRLIRSLILVPYLVPTAAVGYMAVWMGNSQWGIVNQLLVEVGLLESAFPWFGNPKTAMVSVILANSWKFTLFATILVLARLQSIPDSYYEAAQMAGAKPWQRFRDVTLPNIKNVVLIIVLLRGIWMFNQFDLIWVMTKGGPSDATMTAPILIYRTAFIGQELGKASAMATLLFLLIAATAIVYFVVFQPSTEVQVQ